MKITIQSATACRNEQPAVLDYVANNGNGRAKFVLATALSAAPLDKEYLLIVDIDNVGDSDVFLFGCDLPRRRTEEPRFAYVV